MLLPRRFLTGASVAQILLIVFALAQSSSGQVIRSLGGEWGETLTWDLNRVPQPGDQVVISAGTTVILDAGASWMQTFQRIEVAGTLYPRITPNSALPVILRANTCIEVAAGGRVLGYDRDNASAEEAGVTGVSVPIELVAPVVNNFGEITGGGNFRGYWGNAEVSAAPSFIWIGPMNASGIGPQTLVFRNTGRVRAGSGVMGPALACGGGLVTILARDSILNNAGGIIESGHGYVSVPPPLPNATALGGDVIMGWVGNDQGWWCDGWQWETGTHVIDGDGGIIRGGFDVAPGESYSGVLWMEVGDEAGDYLSLSDPGTRAHKFGSIVLRSWRTEAGTGIRLSDLDEQAIYGRRNYLGAIVPGPANGGGLWIDYLEDNQVDLRLNPAGTVVLAAEEEDFGGYEAGIHFSHFEESSDVLLDPGVSLDTLCDPDPTFFASRSVDCYSAGRLSWGWPAPPAPGQDFFLPSLGLPGDTAYVFLRFRKLGVQDTYRIQIQDTRGYTFWPQTVWISESASPDTTVKLSFRIPQADTAGTQNPLLITSATYPEGELADTLRSAVVVVPPVKVLAERGIGTAPGFTDTVSVSVHNYLHTGQTFNIVSFSEGWSLTPGMRSPWIPADCTMTVEFYVQIPPEAELGETNWTAFRASVSGGRTDFWDADSSVVKAIVLDPPEGLVIRTSDNDVMLNWRSVSDALHYQVLCSHNGPSGPWTTLPVTSDTFYVHTGVISSYGKTYYAVKAARP